jgi:uncharacterized membrane protein YgcG
MQAAQPQQPTGKLDARTLAQSKREAMHRRARQIRRSVAALAVALFTAAFLAVYVQLASGNDPTLSKRPTSATTASKHLAAATKPTEAKAGAETEVASGSSGTSSGEASTGSSSAGGESSQSATAVTTSQS